MRTSPSTCSFFIITRKFRFLWVLATTSKRLAFQRKYNKRGGDTVLPLKHKQGRKSQGEYHFETKTPNLHTKKPLSLATQCQQLLKHAVSGQTGKACCLMIAVPNDPSPTDQTARPYANACQPRLRVFNWNNQSQVTKVLQVPKAHSTQQMSLQPRRRVLLGLQLAISAPTFIPGVLNSSKNHNSLRV